MTTTILTVIVLHLWCILIFCLLHLDTPCFLNNLVYNFNQNQECVKSDVIGDIYMRTPQECQLACQQTSGCSKFSYYTSFYKDPEHMERQECCYLFSETKLANYAVTKKPYVISGPKFCPSENAEKTPSNNNVRDAYSGETINSRSTLREESFAGINFRTFYRN